ncbi:acid proteinase [Niveomyces insectorum RCEF 264]|uniref:Acid proteinase n=1 Tax=Niveomyces insectorum RCEF 264 TaxID=1081102 RepID=A0A167PWC9_9HYPO|nr:acid proteinase [Niveomyces insectorum RCEF 264]
MKFFAAAVSILLSAEAVLASPVTLVPRESRSAQRASQRRTRPRVGVPGPAVKGANGGGGAAPIAHVDYSQNWAGAVLVGSGYTSVTGTFTVPTPKQPSGGSSSTQYAASAWVGLDGDTCQTAILQTGIDFNVKGKSVSFDAWYEWFPDYAYTFSGFEIRAGDVIRLTAAATSKSAGSVLIENHTTGKNVSHAFTGESNELCETNAEWIVEDFEAGGSLVPFANFGTVTFTDCAVTRTGGTTTGVSGATIIDMEQDNNLLTSCNTSGANKVTCSYV